MRFYLGTHKPVWLSRLDVPLFLSRNRLVEYKTLPVALGSWALDSGAFTELQKHGAFTFSPEDYCRDARRFRDQVGQMEFAAPMDWMCEPIVIEGGTVNGQKFHGTHLSVLEHQRRTVENYLLLKRLAPDLPWIPVLQGYSYQEYLRCREMYESAGVRLEQLPLVGLGSVCRRQDTSMVEELLRELHGEGLKIHGFGFKLLGLRRAARYLESSDSMAWSFDARRAPPLPGHTHKSCSNCMEWALRWREKALRAISGNQGAEQLGLFAGMDDGYL